jgi:hypothetical protein
MHSRPPHDWSVRLDPRATQLNKITPPCPSHGLLINEARGRPTTLGPPPLPSNSDGHNVAWSAESRVTTVWRNEELCVTDPGLAFERDRLVHFNRSTRSTEDC